MNLLTALARFLIFPGLLFAVPAAWLVLWLERKTVALLQQRIGPPFGQPFFDFVKLMGKSTPPRPGINGLLMRAWPLIAVSASAGAVGMLPVLPSLGGFQGDLILLLALMEIPAICMIVAGFSSRSLFGEIGSAREAVLLVSYNLVFLLAAVSIAVSEQSFRLESLAGARATPWRYLGLTAILLCLPAKLHINPFSLPNAEQEIYSGPMTEYAGFELALWKLSHGLEWIAGVGPGCHTCHSAIHSPLAGCIWCSWAWARCRPRYIVYLRGDGSPRHRHNGSVLLAVHPRLRCHCNFDDIAHEVTLMKIFGLLWQNLRRGVGNTAISRCSARHDWLSGPGAVRSHTLYRLRDVPLPLHRTRHHFQCGRQGFHLGLQPLAMHLLRPLR